MRLCLLTLRCKCRCQRFARLLGLLLWQQQTLPRQVLHLADEKVNLASKIYDYVDQRIRRLDLDMAAFDEELARDRAKLGVMVRRPADAIFNNTKSCCLWLCTENC